MSNSKYRRAQLARRAPLVDALQAAPRAADRPADPTTPPPARAPDGSVA